MPAPTPPPWRPKAPGSPALRTAAFPRQAQQQIIGLTWTQSPVSLPPLYSICQFPSSVTRCCTDCCLSLCTRVLMLFVACSLSVPH